MVKTTTIYHVEDSLTVGKLTQVYLQAHHKDWNIVHFQTAELMLMQLMFEHPEIIIVDYMLDTRAEGKLNGDDTLAKLRERGINIPVILLTGVSNEQKLQRFKTLDFDSVIYKHKDDVFEELDSRINSILTNNL